MTFVFSFDTWWRIVVTQIYEYRWSITKFLFETSKGLQAFFEIESST